VLLLGMRVHLSSQSRLQVSAEFHGHSETSMYFQTKENIAYGLLRLLGEVCLQSARRGKSNPT
jgi:hypothetical protein